MVAGYIINTATGSGVEFHIGDSDLDQKLSRIASRVVTLQLDGDELEAVRWGLLNYNKVNPNR